MIWRRFICLWFGHVWTDPDVDTTISSEKMVGKIPVVNFLWRRDCERCAKTEETFNPWDFAE